MSSIPKEFSTPSLVEQYQKKVLQGITEINTKMQTLPFEDRMAYLLHAQTSLSFRINEVRQYIQQPETTERAQDLEAMHVIEQDLLRTISRVWDLQERHRLGSASNNSRLPTPMPRGDRGRRASLAPTITVEKIGERYKYATIKGILRPPRKEFFENSPQGTGKVEAVKEELGLN